MAAGQGVAESIVEGAGVAGSPNGGIVSVQGVSGGTGIPVTPGPFDAGDAVTLATTPRVLPYLFNGTTADRVRSITATDNVALTGILAVAPRYYNGAGWDVGRDANGIGDGVNGQGMAAVGSYVYDGSLAQWNRLRGPGTAAGLTGPTGIVAAASILATTTLTDNARARDLTTAASPTGVAKVGPARLIDYGVVARLTTRPYYLSHVFGAAGRFQYLTLFHGAGALKTVRLISVVVYVASATAAAAVTVDLSRLTSATTPATGNPAVTPQAGSGASAAAELTALCLPTTQGTEASAASPFLSADYNLGVIGAVPTANPPPGYQRIQLWPPTAGFTGDDPLIRAGNAEGWAIVVDVSAATTIAGRADVVVTEE